MPLTVDPALAAIFGSEDRVRTLSALANSDVPLTAYRVAAIMEMNPPNVYRELKRLERVHVVKRSAMSLGRSGWELTDEFLRVFLRARFRVSWSEEWMRGSANRKRRTRVAMRDNGRVPLDLTKFEPGRKPSRLEIDARREKDRVLAKARARPSIRGSD